MTNIIKKDDSPPSGVSLTKGKLTSKGTSFQQRINQARAQRVDAASLPNRLCLMLDKSSSMSTKERGDQSRIELLKDAVTSFAQKCDFINTAIAIETFPSQLELPLTSDELMITTSLFGLNAGGNTPMRQCVERCLEKVKMTRGIIVSDGEATDWHTHVHDMDESDDVGYSKEGILEAYKKAGIPIDTVHIGDSSGGEALLRHIATATGGIYLKFTDVSAFAVAFGYLTPGYRAMLTDGCVTARDIGASEIRR